MANKYHQQRTHIHATSVTQRCEGMPRSLYAVAQVEEWLHFSGRRARDDEALWTEACVLYIMENKNYLQLNCFNLLFAIDHETIRSSAIVRLRIYVGTPLSPRHRHRG